MDFDPNAFMEQAVDAPLATSPTLCPEGQWQAVIDDFDTSERYFREITSEKGTFHIFSCPFVIQDEGVKQQTGRDKVVVSMDMFLDIDPATGQLRSEGDANWQLGRVKEAVGQKDVIPWGFGMLRGAGPVLVNVRHRQIDQNDPERKAAEVNRVVRIS